MKFNGARRLPSKYSKLIEGISNSENAIRFTCYRTKNGTAKVSPSDRWTDALKRTKVIAAMNEPHEEGISPKRKWWNAKNIVAGLQQVDESDISTDEEGDKEEEDEDSDDLEKRRRRKLMEKVKKGKTSAKIMESPV